LIWENFKRVFVFFISICAIGTTTLYASTMPQESNDTPTMQSQEESNATLLHAAADDTTAVAIGTILNGETALDESSPLSHAIRLYYIARQFKPVWSSEQQLLPTVATFIQLIDGIAGEGLDPERRTYHRKRIEALIAQGTTEQPQQLARLDLLLTDAFFALGHDLHYGMAYGADLNTSNEYANVPVDMADVLDQAVANRDIKTSLLSLTPQHPEYRRLTKALAYYRRLADEGGWSTNISDYSHEAAVRKRLIATGDLIEFASDSTLDEDEKLEAAVKRFQKRHGLKADGVVGPVTSSEMAVPLEKLIEKIKLNMEKWKWLPPHNRGPYIVVNIPGFELDVILANETVLQTRAIVGRRDRETPTFASKLNYLVFNPYWNVPETILNEDLIPKLQADPYYLATRRIKIFAAGDRNGVHPIDPATIDWKHWQKTDVGRYVFRMEPGADNPLGYIKFIFPNNYDVYVHDTPSHSLFKNSNGTFSSGCIRIRKPLELAHYLLARQEPDITYKDIMMRILSGERKWVLLKDPLDIYITYQTARVGEDGLMYFYEDIYGYDRKLARFLSKSDSYK